MYLFVYRWVAGGGSQKKKNICAGVRHVVELDEQITDRVGEQWAMRWVKCDTIKHISMYDACGYGV